MRRISYDVEGKTSGQIFRELEETFSRDDYSAATSSFDKNGDPQTVIILTNTLAVETYLRLRFEGIEEFRFTIHGEYDVTEPCESK